MPLINWNDRYAGEAFVFGEQPNAFVAQEAHCFLPGMTVVDLGAGEGRNAAFLARLGCRVTAVDGSAVGLAKIARLPGGERVETVAADLTTWHPGRQWDRAVVTFIHLPPEEHAPFFARIRQILRPGGMVVAEWYRPEHRARGLHGGPPDPARMVTKHELADAFPAEGIVLLEEADIVLDEGPGHQGPACVVRLVWQKPEAV